MLGPMLTINLYEALGILTLIIFVAVFYFYISRRPSFENVYDENAIRLLATESSPKPLKAKKAKKKSDKKIDASKEQQPGSSQNVDSPQIQSESPAVVKTDAPSIKTDAPIIKTEIVKPVPSVSKQATPSTSNEQNVPVTAVSVVNDLLVSAAAPVTNDQSVARKKRKAKSKAQESDGENVIAQPSKNPTIGKANTSTQPSKNSTIARPRKIETVQDVIDQLSNIPGVEYSYVQFLTDHLDGKEAKITELQQDMKLKANDFHALETKLSKAQTQIVSLQDEIAKSKKDRVWEHRFTTKEKEYQDLAKSNKKLLDRLSSLETLQKEYEEKTAILMSQIQSITDEQNQEKLNHNMIMEDCGRRAKEVKAEYDQIERTVCSKLGVASFDVLLSDGFQPDDHVKEEKIRELEAVLENSNRQNCRLMETVKSLESDLKSQKELLDNADVERRIHSQSVELLKAANGVDNEKATAGTVGLEEELSALRASEARIQELETELSIVRSEFAKAAEILDNTYAVLIPFMKESIFKLMDKCEEQCDAVTAVVEEHKAEKRTERPEFALAYAYQRLLKEHDDEKMYNRTMLAQFSMYKDEQCLYNRKIMANYNALKKLVEELNEEVKNFEEQKRALAEQAKQFDEVAQELSRLKNIQGKCESNFKKMDALEEENRRLKEMCLKARSPAYSVGSSPMTYPNENTDDTVTRVEGLFSVSSNVTEDERAELQRKVNDLTSMNDSLSARIAELRDRNTNIVEQAMKGREAVALVDVLNETVGKLGGEKLSANASLEEMRSWLSQIAANSGTDKMLFAKNKKVQKALEEDVATMVQIIDVLHADMKRSQASKPQRDAYEVPKAVINKKVEREAPESLSDWEML